MPLVPLLVSRGDNIGAVDESAAVVQGGLMRMAMHHLPKVYGQMSIGSWRVVVVVFDAVYTNKVSLG